MDVILHLAGRILGRLDEIGRKGLASSGYRQDEEFCIRKALDEFIAKYLPFKEDE